MQAAFSSVDPSPAKLARGLELIINEPQCLDIKQVVGSQSLMEFKNYFVHPPLFLCLFVYSSSPKDMLGGGGRETSV